MRAYKARKLQIILFSLIAITVLAARNTISVYADDGRDPGSHGRQGTHPNRGAPSVGNQTSYEQHMGSPSNNFAGNQIPPWGPPPSGNFTGSKPPDPPLHNLTNRWPPPPPLSNNMTDNMTGRWLPSPLPSDSVTDNFTVGRPLYCGEDENYIDDLLDRLAEILNIDKQTLVDTLKQVLGDLFNN